MEKNSTLLYPLLVIAAISVTLVSMVGIAAMTGHLPNAFSQEGGESSGQRQVSPENLTAPGGRATVGPNRDMPARPEAGRAPSSRSCADCGVVQSVGLPESQGESTRAGAITGGVAAGVLGERVRTGHRNVTAVG